jgi:hypothetical protein
MNGTTFAAGSSLTAMLAGVLVWATHGFPPMDAATAMDASGLLIAIFGGGGIASFNVRAAAKAAETEIAKAEAAAHQQPAAPAAH